VTIVWYYFLKCKNTNCEQPIWLPLPILRESEPNQLLWPWDSKPRNFLCRDCNHAYEYTLRELDYRPGDIPVQVRRLVDDTVFRIETQCGVENCGLPVYILITGNSQQSNFAVVPGWFVTKKTGNVRCTSGHMTDRLLYQVPDIHKDADWA
jgi:hypothetical protein